MVSRTESSPFDILHVASFAGNVGDNGNHNGTRKQLSSVFDRPLIYEESEIRKYYQNYNRPDKLAFDEEFVQRANSVDLVLIGGGSFFDIWVDNETGCTINLTSEQIEKIDTPIVFHGLGCIPGVDVPEEIVDRFRTFFDTILDAEQCLVSVRNDGSLGNIRDVVGKEYADRIHKIPDGGFFMNIDDYSHKELPRDKTTIGICTVSNIPDRRFPGSDCLTYDEYTSEMAMAIDTLLNQHDDYHIVFVPHIYSDHKGIADVLEKMDLWYRRNRVTTAPYLNGEGAEHYIFDLYRKFDVSMGLRLHSNICPIGVETASIGLANGHPKVGDLYQEIGFSEQTVAVHKPGFSDRLVETVEQTLNRQHQIEDSYADLIKEMKSDIEVYHRKVRNLVIED